MSEISTDVLDLLVHYHYDPSVSGNLTAGQPLIPQAAQIGGVLPEDEQWEIMSYPVISFAGGQAGLQAGTAPQEFHVRLLVDDNEEQVPNLNWSAAPDLLYSPPYYYLDGYGVERQPVFAEGLVAALKAQAAGEPMAKVLEKAASVKVGKNLTFYILPITNITEPFDIKIYGKRWVKTAYDRVLTGQQIKGVYSVTRPVEKDSISFDVQFPVIDWDTFTQQPGGMGQGTLRVRPFAVFGINTQASTLNTDYPFSYVAAGVGGNPLVATSHQNLDFRFNPRQTGGNKVLYVSRFGARSRWQYATSAGGTHLRYSFIVAESDVVHKHHPWHLFITTDYDNVIGFGYQQPFGPANGKYRLPPKFPFAMFNDRFYVGVRDDGLGTIQPGQAAVVLTGTLVEGYPSSAQIVRAGNVVRL